MERNKVIAEGCYGMVVHPPALCIKDLDEKYFKDDYIGKIATHKELKKEYDFILEYLKLNTRYSHYIKKEDVVLCKINLSKLDNKWKQELEEENKIYQLIMPYLGNGLTFSKFLKRYKNVCSPEIQSDSNIKKEVISIQEYKNVLIALRQLRDDILQLNTRKIYHNDIKSNNIIYVEKENELLLIDYNTSIHLKIPDEFAKNITFYQSFYDLYCFTTLVLFPFLKVAFTNQAIYLSPLFSYYEEWKKDMDINIQNAIKGLEAIDDKQITKQMIDKMEQFFILSETLQETHTVENTEDAFCKKKYQMTVKEQRDRAALWNETLKRIKEESKIMAMEDTRRPRGGKKHKKTKKIHRKTRKTRKSKKCLA